MSYRRHFTVLNPPGVTLTTVEAYVAAKAQVEYQLHEESQSEFIVYSTFTELASEYAEVQPYDPTDIYGLFGLRTNVVIPVENGHKVWFVISGD